MMINWPAGLLALCLLGLLAYWLTALLASWLNDRLNESSQSILLRLE